MNYLRSSVLNYLNCWRSLDWKDCKRPWCWCLNRNKSRCRYWNRSSSSDRWSNIANYNWLRRRLFCFLDNSLDDCWSMIYSPFLSLIVSNKMLGINNRSFYYFRLLGSSFRQNRWSHCQINFILWFIIKILLSLS